MCIGRLEQNVKDLGEEIALVKRGLLLSPSTSAGMVATHGKSTRAAATKDVINIIIISVMVHFASITGYAITSDTGNVIKKLFESLLSPSSVDKKCMSGLMIGHNDGILSIDVTFAILGNPTPACASLTSYILTFIDELRNRARFFIAPQIHDSICTWSISVSKSKMMPYEWKQPRKGGM